MTSPPQVSPTQRLMPRRQFRDAHGVLLRSDPYPTKDVSAQEFRNVVAYLQISLGVLSDLLDEDRQAVRKWNNGKKCPGPLTWVKLSKLQRAKAEGRLDLRNRVFTEVNAGGEVVTHQLPDYWKKDDGESR